VKRVRGPTIPRAYSRIDVRLERRDVAVDDAHTLFGPENIRTMPDVLPIRCQGVLLVTLPPLSRWKNSTNTEACAFGISVCVWPDSVWYRALGNAAASARYPYGLCLE
jgi:hypothetical protein